MRKRIADVCAEIAVREGYVSVDVGLLWLLGQMWFECKEQGLIKCNLNHPISRLYYISKCLAEDCKRKDGKWYCDSTITYSGICRRPVNVYTLRKESL